MRNVLGNSALSRLVAAFGLVNIAEWAFVVALAVHVYAIGGALAVGLIGFRMLPGAVASLASGGGENPRRCARVLTTVTVARALIAALTAGSLIAGASLVILVVLVCIDAVVAARYRPAQAALIPHLATEVSEVTATAAATSIAKTVAQAVGAIVGGALVAIVNVEFIAAGAAALFALAAILTTGLAQQVPVAALPQIRHRRSMSRLGELWAVAAHPDAAVQLLLSGLRTFVRGQWTALAVVFVATIGGLGRFGVGVLMAAAGAGAVLAMGVTVAVLARAHLALPCAVAFALCGATVAITAVVPTAFVVFLLIAVWGAAMAVSDATSIALLCRSLNAAVLGRAIGVIEAVKLAAEGLGALAVPLLVGGFGVRGALIAAGLPLPIVVVLFWRSLRRSEQAAEGRQEIIALIRRVPLFRRLPIPSTEAIAAALTPDEVADGVDVLVQDEVGDRVFLIEAGHADVLVDGYKLRTLGPGECFGERAVLTSQPRSATVRASGRLRVYSLAAPDFLAALGGGSPEATVLRADDAPGVIAATPLFKSADAAQRAELVATSSLVSFEPGDFIVREGSPGDAVFVLMSGRAQVFRGSTPVRDLFAGDLFGEIAVLHATTRTASVQAVGPASVLRIGADGVLAAVGR